MIPIIKQREMKEFVEYRIEFTDKDGCGFSFEADERGNVILQNECQRANYEAAMAHPEMYDRFNKFTVRKRTYIEPAIGRCRCGGRVELESRYYGACQCERCGQWYNVFGQELMPPEHWED